jgi:TPP-dependent pyruvate/acetoin dehydrogenase alpha subunit
MRDGGYRTQEEIDIWKARDPIKLYKAHLIEIGTVTQAEIDALDEDIRKTAEAAADFARKSPLPDPATVTDYLYS